MSYGTESTPSPSTQPMPHGHRPAASAQVPATLVPVAGWHVLHLFYRIDRRALAALPEADRRSGREQVLAALERPASGSIEQMQCFAVPGHKADFGVVMAGPDLKAI